MPAAAPVHAHTVPASAPLRAKGAVKGGEASAAGSASVSGTASGGDFGQYFREQAGTVALTTPVTGAHGPEAKSASGADPAPASAEPRPSLAGSGLAGSAAAATLPDSPQSLLLDELQGKPHGTAAEIVAAEGAQAGGETVSTAAAPGSTTEADKAKITKASSSLKDTDQKDKAENAASPKDTASALPVPLVPPSTASPAAIGPAPLVPPLPLKPAIVAISGNTQPARAGANPQGVNVQKLTGGKAAPPVGAAAEIGSAAPLAQGVPGGAALATQVSSGDGRETSGTENGDARSSGDAKSRESSPAAPGPRAGQAAAMPATAAPASLSASPAAAHSDAPSFPLPHVVSGPPAPSPSAAGGASPTGATVLYDRLDQAAAPVVLHSGAQHVSVGVHDPNLGWVEIQTQSSGGHVDAMLVASSGQTHDSLAAQLPAIAQFLEQRDVRVGTLAVQQPAQPPASGSGQGGGTSSGGGMGSGTGYSGDGGAGARHSGSANAGDGREAPRPGGFRTARPGGIPGAASGPGSGGDALPYRPLSYISVRA